MNTRIDLWLLLLCMLVLCQGITAQVTVYPGDANNNGIVNNIDVLYIGYSFGTPGPSRVLTDAQFEPQEAPTAWANAFPDGTSYAYADANGDGIISAQDLLTVNRNYGATHPPVIPDGFPEAPAGASLLHLENENEPVRVIPGSEFSIPLFLNKEDLPLELNGLAFSLEYNAEIVKEIRLDWESNWFNADSNWYSMQVPVAEETARLEVAATRFGDNPIIGAGLLGRVNIIIEDDLIGLLPAPTDTLDVLVSVKKIRGIGKNFEDILIGGNDFTFTLYHPDARPNKVKEPHPFHFTIFPNPASDLLVVEADKNIQNIYITDLLGRTITWESRPGSKKIQLPVTDLPPGLYLLSVQTEGGFESRELLIE